MKKIAKLSLVAAVAVAGFTTTASAGALEDAIKNTSILGYATYRYDDRNRDIGTQSNDFTSNSHKIALGLVSKITDDLTYTYVGATGVWGDDTSNGVGVDYMSNDAGLLTVYSNFTYTGFANTSIIVGQQGLNTPMTDVYDDISGTQEGTGVAVVSTLGPVTLVGGYMNQTNITTFGKNTDLAILQAMANVGPVALDGTYLDFKDQADAYSIGAKGSVELGSVALSPYARYTALSTDAGADYALWYVGSKAKLGAFGFNASYTATEDDGGLVAVNDDADAEAVNQGWALNLLSTAKGHQTNLNASYAINSAYTAAISHNMRDQAGDKDNETYGQLTWKPAKNFYAYIRYGVVDYDGESEGQRGRLHMTYTF